MASNVKINEEMRSAFTNTGHRQVTEFKVQSSERFRKNVQNGESTMSNDKTELQKLNKKLESYITKAQDFDKRFKESKKTTEKYIKDLDFAQKTIAEKTYHAELLETANSRLKTEIQYLKDEKESNQKSIKKLQQTNSRLELENQFHLSLRTSEIEGKEETLRIEVEKATQHLQNEYREIFEHEKKLIEEYFARRTREMKTVQELLTVQVSLKEEIETYRSLLDLYMTSEDHGFHTTGMDQTGYEEGKSDLDEEDDLEEPQENTMEQSLHLDIHEMMAQSSGMDEVDEEQTEIQSGDEENAKINMKDNVELESEDPNTPSNDKETEPEKISVDGENGIQNSGDSKDPSDESKELKKENDK